MNVNISQNEKEQLFEIEISVEWMKATNPNSKQWNNGDAYRLLLEHVGSNKIKGLEILSPIQTSIVENITSSRLKGKWVFPYRKTAAKKPDKKPDKKPEKKPDKKPEKKPDKKPEKKPAKKSSKK